MFDEGIIGRNVPDCLWPTNNEYDIPLLDFHKQGNAVDLPVLVWGSTGRTTRNKGTWAFYTDDYRFNGVWRSPEKVVQSGCVSVIEPNYTIINQTPVAMALWGIYKKRWLARYWQEFGAKKVFVDMNVGTRYSEFNLLGVPKGWKAYATRGYEDKIDDLLYEYDLAQQHAETTNIIFVVYGGGRQVQEKCRHFASMTWIADQRTSVRERNGHNNNG